MPKGEVMMEVVAAVVFSEHALSITPDYRPEQ